MGFGEDIENLGEGLLFVDFDGLRMSFVRGAGAVVTAALVTACVADDPMDGETRVDVEFADVADHADGGSADVDSHVDEVGVDSGENGNLNNDEGVLQQLESLVCESNYVPQEVDFVSEAFEFALEARMCALDGYVYFNEVELGFIKLMFVPAGELDTEYNIGHLAISSLLDISFNEPWHLVTNSEGMTEFCHTFSMATNRTMEGFEDFIACETVHIPDTGLDYADIKMIARVPVKNAEGTAESTNFVPYHYYIAAFEGVPNNIYSWSLVFTDRDMVIEGGYDGSMILEAFRTFSYAFVSNN